MGNHRVSRTGAAGPSGTSWTSCPERRRTIWCWRTCVGFLGSGAHQLLAERLRTHGLHRLDLQVCPSRFGLPNQRPRVVRGGLPQRPLAPETRAGPGSAPDRGLPGRGGGRSPVPESGGSWPAIATAWTSSRPRIVAAPASSAATASATSAAAPSSRRRAESADSRPSEVARLLGLPAGFRFPDEVSLEARYKLLGNGLSIPWPPGSCPTSTLETSTRDHGAWASSSPPSRPNSDPWPRRRRAAGRRPARAWGR